MEHIQVDFENSPLLKLIKEMHRQHFDYSWTEDELIPVVEGMVARLGKHYWRYNGKGWIRWEGDHGRTQGGES